MTTQDETLRVIKRFGGFPCCHRQWRDRGHCHYLHGYDRWVEVEWEGTRDERGWVVDFADLKVVRDALEYQFDHTVLVSEDDPCLEQIQYLGAADALDLRIMDPTMEGMVNWVRDQAVTLTATRFPNAKVIRVTCWENEKNAASWQVS